MTVTDDDNEEFFRRAVFDPDFPFGNEVLLSTEPMTDKEIRQFVGVANFNIIEGFTDHDFWKCVAGIDTSLTQAEAEESRLLGMRVTHIKNPFGNNGQPTGVKDWNFLDEFFGLDTSACDFLRKNDPLN